MSRRLEDSTRMIELGHGIILFLSHCHEAAATVSFLLDCQVSRNSLTYKQLTKLPYAPETEKKKLEKMIRLKQHCSIMGSSFDHFDVQVHSNRDNQSRRLKIIDEVHIRSGDG